MGEFIYGPVPSRRLGRSLGVDLLVPKSCTIDCVYCQLGSHAPLKPERKRFVDPARVEAELAERAAAGVEAEYITFSGSGEPTLSVDLGRVLNFAKGLKIAPVCVLTNGTLLWMPEVREELSRADVVIPNLDAADEETFQLVNRPHSGLDFDRIVEGLIAFSRVFAGKLLLEIVLVNGLNDSEEHLAKLAELVGRIAPAGVWVGSVHRPPAESFARPASAERLELAQKIIGDSARIIEDFRAKNVDSHFKDLAVEVETLLRRRPETARGIAESLGADSREVAKALSILETEGKILRRESDGELFYQYVGQ